MRFSGLIATCSIVLLVSMNVNSFLEIQSTDRITAAVQEKDSVSQTYNINETNNYETHNHYESDNTDKIEELEEKITELEESKEKVKQEEQVLVGVNQNGVVYQAQPTKEVWRGPKSYKCNMAAGYPAECGYCGEIGEIHFNIKEWQDEQGTYHLTHVGCGQKYCDKVGVQPRIEESYKIR